jgi:hypothetical protein
LFRIFPQISSEGMRQPTIHQMREKKNHRGKVKEVETFQYPKMNLPWEPIDAGRKLVYFLQMSTALTEKPHP